MKEQLAHLKKDVLGLGEEAQGFVYAQISKTGKISWRYGGSLQDASFLMNLLTLNIHKEMEKNLMEKKDG